MSKDKGDTGKAGAAEAKPVEKKMNVEAEITSIKAVLRRVLSVVEKFTSIDLDEDGKIGAARWAVSGLVGLGMLVAVAAIAAEKILWRGVAPEGDDAVLELSADEEDDTADQAQLIMQADGSFVVELGGTDRLTVNSSGNVTASGTISGTPSSGTVATGVTATVTATESYGVVNKVILALASMPVVVAEGGTATNGFGSAQIYDFPEGEIQILGVVVNDLTFGFDTNDLDGADGGDFSIGTAAATSPTGTLTQAGATFVDILAETSMDPVSNAVDAVKGTVAAFNGTAMAKDAYLNILIDDGDISAATTNLVTATITFHYINLGDD